MPVVISGFTSVNGVRNMVAASPLTRFLYFPALELSFQRPSTDGDTVSFPERNPFPTCPGRSWPSLSCPTCLELHYARHEFPDAF
ncbi:hypothetical protein AVEN_48454-1 [Araneus ventricosus]|uniref:Uncharacterized protein n=1 Tax=Araneus ventricosus TaxID=182803 RepID=A0A4Y2NV45_ARAVE|nr:hypothetical protein AVEN_48454-1 [Araneus ventricosus]